METMLRFRRVALLAAGLVTAALATVSAAVNLTFAVGLGAGATAGMAGFWVITRDLEAVVTAPDAVLKLRARAALRYLLYGVVLLWTFWLDRETVAGMAGAVAGLFVMRTILIVLGMTGAFLRAVPKTPPLGDASDS